MLTTFLQRLLLMTALLAVQMLVLNHIHVMGFATPLLIVYFLLLFPLGTSRWSIMLWGFVCGLLADMATLTPGVGAGAMTLVAFVQPVLLMAMRPKEAAEDMQASFHTMGFAAYVRYCSILTFIFCFAYFLLQSFSFFHIVHLAISFGSSWLLTLVICIAVEAMRPVNSRKTEN
ncbi:MAG: rod shape-determining protein MreD [Bacteroidaceae bacterium]|nr:rod shape-determining protein MreD [Bacteroidaceae bacterium]